MGAPIVPVTTNRGHGRIVHFAQTFVVGGTEFRVTGHAYEDVRSVARAAGRTPHRLWALARSVDTDRPVAYALGVAL